VPARAALVIDKKPESVILASTVILVSAIQNGAALMFGAVRQSPISFAMRRS